MFVLKAIHFFLFPLLLLSNSDIRRLALNLSAPSRSNENLSLPIGSIRWQPETYWDEYRKLVGEKLRQLINQSPPPRLLVAGEAPVAENEPQIWKLDRASMSWPPGLHHVQSAQSGSNSVSAASLKY